MFYATNPVVNTKHTLVTFSLTLNTLSSLTLHTLGVHTNPLSNTLSLVNTKHTRVCMFDATNPVGFQGVELTLNALGRSTLP